MNRILRAIPLPPVSSGLGICLLWTLAVMAGAQEPANAAQERLAALHGQTNAHAIDVAWPYLDSRDAAVREAARLIVEEHPFAAWRQRAFDEKSTWASLEALRAVVEACPRAQAAEVSPHLCEQITTLRIDEMNEAQQLAVLQLTRSVFVRLGPVSADERSQILDLWSHLNGPLTERAKAELTRLKAFLEKAPTR
jgi:hypothetical protein